MSRSLRKVLSKSAVSNYSKQLLFDHPRLGNVRFGSKADIGACVCVMSALPPKADIGTHSRDVCFVPEADITLSELGAIFAGNFVQLLLASLYWRCAGSRSYFAEKIFQPGRCNGPEQN